VLALVHSDATERPLRLPLSRSEGRGAGRRQAAKVPDVGAAPAYAQGVLEKALPRRPAWRRLLGWLRPLTDLGTLPSDSEEVRLRKAVLTLSSSLMATLAFVWVGTYAALGLWLSAAIPFAYQLASAASMYTFARTRRYRLFRASQLWMSLVLPFALQWSLGGFANSSAVSLWAFTCPVGALLFVGARQAVRGPLPSARWWLSQPRSTPRSRRARPTSLRAWWWHFSR
jgi:hypothetical protein